MEEPLHGGGSTIGPVGLVLMIPFGPSIEISRYTTSPSATCRERNERERKEIREVGQEKRSRVTTAMLESMVVLVSPLV